MLLADFHKNLFPTISYHISKVSFSSNHTVRQISVWDLNQTFMPVGNYDSLSRLFIRSAIGGRAATTKKTVLLAIPSGEKGNVLTWHKGRAFFFASSTTTSAMSAHSDLWHMHGCELRSARIVTVIYYWTMWRQRQACIHAVSYSTLSNAEAGRGRWDTRGVKPCVGPSVKCQCLPLCFLGNTARY